VLALQVLRNPRAPRTTSADIYAFGIVAYEIMLVNMCDVCWQTFASDCQGSEWGLGAIIRGLAVPATAVKPGALPHGLQPFCGLAWPTQRNSSMPSVCMHSVIGRVQSIQSLLEWV
jgi:hypothetical protein